MTDILSLPDETKGMLTLEQWQPPLKFQSQAVEVEKAESEFLTPAYQEQMAISNEAIETTPLSIVDFGGFIDKMAAEGTDPSVAASALADIASKNDEYNRLLAKGLTLSFTDIDNSKDPNVTAAQFKIDYRASKAAERLTSIAEEFSGGNFDALMEAVDNFTYDVTQSFNPFAVVTAIEGGGSEVTGKSQEWLAAMSTMTDEQFDAFLVSKEEELRNSDSYRKGENQAWVVLRELQALESAGYIPGDIEQAQLGASIDLLTLDVGAVVSVVKTGVKAFSKVGRSAVYRARTVLGTEGGTKAALRMMPSGVTSEARVAEDILPTALAAPERAFVKVSATPTAAKATPTPTVSQGALQANWIIREMLARTKAGAFGAAGLQDDAAQWATKAGQDRIAAVAEAKSTNVIDYSIINHTLEHDGFVGTTATFIMGKASGKSFTSLTNAKEVAQSIPNSRVISTKTGLPVDKAKRGDTYAIQFQERRNYKAEALDLTSLRDRGVLTGTFNWVGSNGLDSKPFFNDLAYSADAGGAKFKHDVDARLKAFDKFNPEEQGAFSAIIQGVQDNGKRNTWLDTDEFTSQYTALTGKTPSKEVIRVYEDVVAASDAAWFVQADKELQQFAKTGVLVFKDKKNAEHLLYPYKGNVDAKVMNGSTGAMLDAKDVPEGAIVYKFMEGKKGRPRYTYNVVGKTRLPEHADAMPYNAGGPRSNPHIRYFAGTMDGGWQTLLGAKTEKQARDSVEQYNKIQSAFNSLKKEPDPENPLNGLTSVEIKMLDDVVLANNKWNKNLETFEEFAQFLSARGVDIRNKMMFKERNAKLEVFEDFGEDFVMRKDVGQYVTYSRHDEHLIEYGGERTWNPNPVQAILSQMNRSIDQAARIQWEQTHVEAWAAALHKAVDPKKTGEVLQVEGYSAMFTGSSLARNVTIKGDTVTARLLRREQSTIVRRLQALEGSSSESRLWASARSGPTKAMNWTMESIYDSEWMPFKDRLVAPLRGLRDGFSGKMLGLGFLTKMASPMQFFLQGSMAIQITARTPRNGFKASFLAGHIREMAAHAQGPALLSAMRKQLAKVAGLTDAQMDNLIKHFETSGRGFAKGAIVEDPDALPGVRMAKTAAGRAVKFGTEKALEVARAPFYAGENYSQTVSRIAAYLDTVERFPKVDIKSKEFWGAVTSRDRSLSMNLNPSSASMAQKDSTVAMWSQWTSFTLRAFETVFFDSTLSKMERVNLAASLTVLWGFAGMGIGGLIPEEWNETVKEALKYGPIDSVLKETVGVTFGDRVAINLPSLMARVGLTASEPAAAAPSLNIAADAVATFGQATVDFFNGRKMLAAYDLGTLVRTFKIVDDPIMAYQMLQGERTTRTGSSLPANYTASQAFLQAIGLRPIQVTEYNALKYTDLANQNNRKFKAIDKAVPSLKLAIEYGNQGDWGNAAYYMQQASAIVDAYGLSETYRSEAIQGALNKAGSDEVSRTVLSAIRAGLGKDALTLMESTQ